MESGSEFWIFLTTAKMGRGGCGPGKVWETHTVRELGWSGPSPTIYIQLQCRSRGTSVISRGFEFFFVVRIRSWTSLLPDARLGSHLFKRKRWAVVSVDLMLLDDHKYETKSPRWVEISATNRRRKRVSLCEFCDNTSLLRKLLRCFWKYKINLVGGDGRHQKLFQSKEMSSPQKMTITQGRGGIFWFSKISCAIKKHI